MSVLGEMRRKRADAQMRREMQQKTRNRASFVPVEIDVGIGITDILDPIPDFGE